MAAKITESSEALLFLLLLFRMCFTQTSLIKGVTIVLPAYLWCKRSDQLIQDEISLA